MPPQNHRTKRKIIITAEWFAAVIALLGLVWAIMEFVIERPTNEQYVDMSVVRLEDDGLVRLVRNDSTLLRCIGLRSRQVVQGGIQSELDERFAPDHVAKEGRTVHAAEFLVVKNNGTQPFRSITFRGSEFMLTTRNVSPTTSVVLPVKMELIGGAVRQIRLENMRVEMADGSRTSIKIATEIGSKRQLAECGSDVYLGYPE